MKKDDLIFTREELERKLADLIYSVRAKSRTGESPYPYIYKFIEDKEAENVSDPDSAYPLTYREYYKLLAESEGHLERILELESKIENK